LRGSTKVNAEAIFRAALEGDRMARSVVKAIVDRLGLATAFLVAALHPPFVVVGAETETAIRCLCKELRSALESRTLTEIASTVEIIEGMEFRPLALIGAGLMVFERTFNDKRHIS
jgi:predicted NBD/HSP70 family sugar kinase